MTNNLLSPHNKNKMSYPMQPRIIIRRDDFSQAPTQETLSQTYTKPVLYKVDANGNVRVWSISFDGRQIVMAKGTELAMKENRLTLDRRDVTPMSNRTLYQQAVLEVDSRWKKMKREKGYGEEPIKETVLTGPAMLAKTWDPTGTGRSGTVKKISHWPVYVQPKLDGVRCTASKDFGGGIKLGSRARIVFNHMNHVRKDLHVFFQFIDAVVKNYPPEYHLYRLDGELYTKEIEFERISGITRLGKDATPDYQEILIDYHIFDIILSPNLTYDQRYSLLQYSYNLYIAQFPKTSLKLVRSFIANTTNDIDCQLQVFLKEKYEGLMIRYVGGTTETERKKSYYVFGPSRSSGLLKYKLFKDEEGIVVGAKEGTGREKGAVIWIVRDKQGNEFSVRPLGSIDERKLYFQNRDKYMGQQYRYKYFEKTNKGLPRFPAGLGFVYDR